MSEQATSSTAVSGASGSLPPQTTTAAENTAVLEGEAETVRRRRRRRRSLKTEGPERRIRNFLLILVVVLLILAVTGAQAGSWLKSLLAQTKGFAQSSGIVAGIRNLLRWEVFALLIAFLILLYLQPGVEDKILRKLGLRKDRKRS
jgi:hypothetical protein